MLPSRCYVVVWLNSVFETSICLNQTQDQRPSVRWCNATCNYCFNITMRLALFWRDHKILIFVVYLEKRPTNGRVSKTDIRTIFWKRKKGRKQNKTKQILHLNIRKKLNCNIWEKVIQLHESGWRLNSLFFNVIFSHSLHMCGPITYMYILSYMFPPLFK